MQLQGELTMRSTPALLRQAGDVIAAGTVDLSAVTIADSAGVAFLLELKRRATAVGKPLQFKHCPAQLRGLVSFFDLEETLQIPEAA
ncbi:MAG: STAS domain-containing protein [Pseudomonadota bacterium]